MSILDPGTDTDIGNVLPRGIEEHARDLFDDDLFVDQVWKVSVGYHDLRSAELSWVGKEEAREPLIEIQASIENLRATLNRNKDKYPIPPELLRDLKNMKNHYASYMVELDTIEGRSTKNRALRWLVGSLTNVFNAHNVPIRKRAGFIDFILPIISPTIKLPSGKEVKDEAPSKSTVRNAINEKRK